jgi:glyoxylase I family protein
MVKGIYHLHFTTYHFLHRDRPPAPRRDHTMPTSLSIRSLHHVAVATRDVPASIAFYCDILGFVPIVRPPFDFPGAWLFNYGLQIHIIQHTAGAPGGAIDPRADHLAFAVDDLNEVERALAGRGIAYHKQVNAGGIPQIFFHDPDGRHIEIGIYPPTPPPIDAQSDVPL